MAVLTHFIAFLLGGMAVFLVLGLCIAADEFKDRHTDLDLDWGEFDDGWK